VTISAKREHILIALLLVAVAAGATCGLARLKILVLIPVTTIFLAVTVIEGRANGLGMGTIVLMLFVGATFSQAGYLIGWLLFEERELPAPRPKALPPELVHAMQSAIGEELRMRYPLPQDLPPQLRVRMAQLKARYG
jgi:hypothetical protein